MAKSWKVGVLEFPELHALYKTLTQIYPNRLLIAMHDKDSIVIFFCLFA